MHDADLTSHGLEMAHKMSELIKDLEINRAISSNLKRAHKTLEAMLQTAGFHNVLIEKNPEINERDYGEYTGKNKWKMKEILGEKRFNCVRREWDCPVPGGETLKMVYDRVVPYYREIILPDIKEGKNIIVTAHTNSIRALKKYIENISDEDIKHLEVPFGFIFIYKVDDEGRALKKETRKLKEE